MASRAHLVEKIADPGPALDIVAVPPGYETVTPAALQQAFDRRVAFQWDRTGDAEVTLSQGIAYLTRRLADWGIDAKAVNLGDAVHALFAPLAAASGDIEALTAEITTLTLTSKQVIVISVKFKTNQHNVALPFLPTAADMLNVGALGITLEYSP